MSEPQSITRSGWYRLLPPQPKPDIWDMCVGNGQHLGWDRCWSFVLTHAPDSRGLSIVWAIAYAMKSACEEVAEAQIQAAYERGWRDACSDFLTQERDPSHPIGRSKQSPYVPADEEQG